MKALAEFMLRRPRTVLCFWALLVACALPFCLRLPEVVQGATETIAGSESDAANRAIERAFGAGAPFPVPVVLQGAAGAEPAELQAATERLAGALSALADVRSVRHFGNGASALLIVETTAPSLGAAEMLTPRLRHAIAAAALPPQFRASVTGAAAMFHDLNRNSAHDLKRAELVGIPLVLAILLLVFRSPVAAVLPLVLAGAAAMVACAGLYLLHPVTPPSAFAQNAVTMIGLGAGVDYALFMVHRFRAVLGRGVPPAQAAIESCAALGPALLLSGAAVGIGFLALFLVNAEFLRSIAVGGLLVIVCAVALSLSVLPLALAALGPRIDWPFTPGAAGHAAPGWMRWARRVMSRPLACLLCAVAVLMALAAPALRTGAWNIGAAQLPAHLESREGYEILAREFGAGWMGPVAVVLQDGASAQPVAARIGRDPRVAAVEIAAGRDGAVLLVVLPHEAPEARATMALVRDLRADSWPEARGARVLVGGASAAMLDFDAEMFGSLWRVIPAVLGITALALIACFRSLVVPLKAILANLAAVLAAYGFLAAAFPQGLNSFVVLMLFTILFGLSMDYEVLLLRSIQEERLRAADNAAAVAAGLARSAGVITSAAAIMVCLFASFVLTELAATRAFGLGLAFAVALDATLIRLIVIPASMKLLGEANWWFPLAVKGERS